MPPWGRPPGRRRDLYDAGAAARFQELDSDIDDGQGVFAFQDQASGTPPPFGSDRLYFNDQDNVYRDEDMAYGEDYGYSEDEEEYERQVAPLVRRKFSGEQEEIVMQRALEKIRRSRAAGRTDVNLTYEELDALERRRVQQPLPQRATPQRKSSSRTSSPNSVRSRKGSWVRPAGQFTAAASPLRSRKDHSSSRRTSDDATAIRPPGFVVPGPSGTSTFVPAGGYPHSQTPPRSRSRQSSHSRSRQIISPTPQYDTPQYAYATPSNRPPSSSSRSRSSSIHPDDPDWALRSRSSFIAQQAYANDALLYQPTPPPPPLQPQPQHYPHGRRVTSGPSDVNYASLRRVPGTVGRLPASNSDPALGYRGSGLQGGGDEEEYVDVAAEDLGRHGGSGRRRRVRR